MNSRVPAAERSVYFAQTMRNVKHDADFCALESSAQLAETAARCQLCGAAEAFATVKHANNFESD